MLAASRSARIPATHAIRIAGATRMPHATCARSNVRSQGLEARVSAHLALVGKFRMNFENATPIIASG